MGPKMVVGSGNGYFREEARTPVENTIVGPDSMSAMFWAEMLVYGYLVYKYTISTSYSLLTFNIYKTKIKGKFHKNKLN